MSDQFSEQELRALFQKNLPNDPMPSGLAESLEQRVLAEVASVLKPDAVYSSAFESEVDTQSELARQPLAVRKVNQEAQPTLLARIFGQLPSLQFGPSFAMVGAAAAILIVLFNFGAGPLQDLFTTTPRTGAPGAPGNSGDTTAIESPTAMITNTAASVVTVVLEPTPTPISEVLTEEPAPEIATESEITTEPAVTELTEEVETVPVGPNTETAEAAETDSERPSETSDEQPVGLTVTVTVTEDADTKSDVTTATTNNNTDTDNQPNNVESGVTAPSEPEATGSPTPTVQAIAQAVATAVPASAKSTSIVLASTPATTSIAATSAATSTATTVVTTEATSTKVTPVSTTQRATSTATPTNTATHTSTAINTPKPTDTRTPAPTATTVPPTSTVAALSIQVSATATPRPSNTQSVPSVSATATPRPSNTPSVPSVSATDTPENTPTDTAVPATDTPENTPTNTAVSATDTPENTPTNTAVPATDTPENTPTNTAVPATDTPENTPTNTAVPATNTPENTPTNTAVPATNTPENTPTNTAVPPTATNTAIPQAANQRPQILDDVVTVDEDGKLDINVLSNDSDIDGDTLTLTAVGQPSSGTVTYDSNGHIVYTPVENYSGADAFTYEVSDGHGPDVIGFVRVTINAINDIPVVANSTISLSEDAGKQSIPILENVSDVENDPITLVGAQGAEHGTITIVDDTLEYTPNANYNGTDTIVYQVTDSSETSVEGMITVEISPVNDAPVAMADSIEAIEDTPAVFNLLENDLDIDGTSSLRILGVSGSISDDINIINEGMAIEYTPSQDFNGTGVFTYTITDGESSASTSVDFTVIAVNDPPIANDDTVTTDEDTVVTITPLANDSDIDNDVSALTININDVQNGTVAEVDGTIKFTPDKDYNGSAGFNYTISDGEFMDVGTVAITITAVNDAPVLLSNNVYTLTEGSNIEITILAPTLVSDVDGDTLSATIVAPPKHAETFSIEGEAGVWTLNYKSAIDYSGPDSLTYDVTDGQGGTLTVVQEFVITEKPDQPPVVTVRDTVTVDEDTSIELNLLEGVTDPEGDALTLIEFDKITDHGVVTTASESSVLYTPNADYNGEDLFHYTISDGKHSVEATINIQVNPVADKPLFTSPPVITATQGVEYLYDFKVSDADGDPISVKLSDSEPAWLTVEGSSQLIGTPGPMDVGEHLIILVATDSTGEKVMQEFVIVVANVNDAPTSLTLTEDSVDAAARTIIYDINFEDPDVADTHSITVALTSPGSFELFGGSSDSAGKLQVILGADTNNVNGWIQVTDSAGETDDLYFSFSVTSLEPTPEVTASGTITATVVPTATIAPTITPTTTVISTDTQIISPTVPITGTDDLETVDVSTQ